MATKGQCSRYWGTALADVVNYFACYGLLNSSLMDSVGGK
jgi:hypothetical protein